MKTSLFIVTGNAVKFKELKHKLEQFFDCEQKVFDEPEIQGTLAEIIKHKLDRAYEVFKHPVLVDDTSVHLEALNGFPGPYAKDFWKCFSPYDTGVKFTGSRMKVANHIGLCMGKGDTIFVDGVVEGKIISPKNNDHQGKEFDIFFQVDGTDKPLIEYSTEEKNKISHRGLAMKNLIEILKKK